MTHVLLDGWRAHLASKRRGATVVSFDVDIRGPGGRRHRVSLGTDDQARAEKAFIIWVREEFPRFIREASQEEPSVRGPDPALRDVIDYYCDVALPNRNRAAKTRSKADQELFEFLRWCAGERIGRVSQVSRQGIDRYTAFLYKEGLAAKTVAGRLAILRACFNAAVDAELIAESPIRKWTMPAIPDVEIRPLLPAEVAAVLEAVRAKRPQVYNAVAWMAFTGNRPSDTAALRWDQVHLTHAVVTRAQVKTRRLATYEIAPPAAAIIEAERARGIPGPIVFTSAEGHPWTVNKLYHLFTRALDAADYPRAVTLKDLRHSFASNLANDPDHPCPLPVLQRLMGHLRIETTMKYVRATDGAPYVAHYANRITTGFPEASADHKSGHPQSPRQRKPRK